MIKHNLQLTTPVLFVIFSRKDTTEKVFAEICKARPKKLYVAADGPRKGKAGEEELCAETRAIINQVNWECEVKTLFRKENLGCGIGVSSAIDWFFSHEEEGIILEDDCVPDQTFFSFCEDLLTRYRYDSRVMHIGGFNVQFGTRRGRASYYFSNFPEIWGWATWRRAWKLFDFQMETYPQFKEENRIKDVFDTARLQKLWLRALDHTLSEKKSSIWGYRWMYTVWSNHGLCITPNQVLVRNIGFDDRGTHTNGNEEVYRAYASCIAEPLKELKHPNIIIPHKDADQKTQEMRMAPTYPTIIRRKAKDGLRKVLNGS